MTFISIISKTPSITGLWLQWLLKTPGSGVRMKRY